MRSCRRREGAKSRFESTTASAVASRSAHRLRPARGTRTRNEHARADRGDRGAPVRGLLTLEVAQRRAAPRGDQAGGPHARLHYWFRWGCERVDGGRLRCRSGRGSGASAEGSQTTAFAWAMRASGASEHGRVVVVPSDSVQLDRHGARAWWRAALLPSGGRRRQQLVRPDGNLAFIKSATLATAATSLTQFRIAPSPTRPS